MWALYLLTFPRNLIFENKHHLSYECLIWCFKLSCNWKCNLFAFILCTVYGLWNRWNVDISFVLLGPHPFLCLIKKFSSSNIKVKKEELGCVMSGLAYSFPHNVLPLKFTQELSSNQHPRMLHQNVVAVLSSKCLLITITMLPILVGYKPTPT